MRVGLAFILCLQMACFLMTGDVATAGPLDVRHVPADAQWLIHVDCETSRTSPFGQTVFEQMFGGRRSKVYLSRIKNQLGIDVATDLKSITLFDTRFQRHHGLVMLRAAGLDADKIVASLKQRHEETSEHFYRGHTLYTWLRGKGKKNEHEVTGCLHGDDTVLVSRDVDVLKRTLEVLDGKSESLAAASPLAKPVAAGEMVSVRTRRIVGRELPFRSPLTQQSEMFTMALGEQDGNVFVHAHLETKSDEVADQLHDIVEGFRALAMLRHGSDEAGKRVFAGLTVAVEGQTLTADWKMLPADAHKMLQIMHEHRKQQHRHRGHHHDRRKRAKDMKPAKQRPSPDDASKTQPKATPDEDAATTSARTISKDS